MPIYTLKELLISEIIPPLAVKQIYTSSANC